jgi:hypothetical protein
MRRIPSRKPMKPHLATQRRVAHRGAWVAIGLAASIGNPGRSGVPAHAEAL